MGTESKTAASDSESGMPWPESKSRSEEEATPGMRIRRSGAKRGPEEHEGAREGRAVVWTASGVRQVAEGAGDGGATFEDEYRKRRANKAKERKQRKDERWGVKDRKTGRDEKCDGTWRQREKD